SYWKEVFGVTHGVMIASAFYERVDRNGASVELKFQPQTGQQMLVACLWSHWVGKNGEELYSFAAVTDEPPEEVAAAGHDRCIIPLKEKHLEAWLNPDGNLKQAYEILDDRERPYYEHQLAA
ncbi:MAG TPA: SOS response-associated peptidase family protein, partial [Burkholderiaceae bacterium]